MKQFLLHVAISWLSIQIGWTLNLQSGHSLISVSVDQTTSLTQYLSNHSGIRSIYKINLNSKQFEEYSSLSSVKQYAPITSISNGDFLYINLDSVQDIKLESSASAPTLQNSTGFQLIRANSLTSLQSLTAHAIQSRIFAIFGLHQNQWYGYFHRPGKAFQKISNQLVQNSSLRPLTQLTEGMAYFVGIRPNAQYLDIQSSLQLPNALSFAKLKFRNSLSSNQNLTALGQSKSDANGSWAGEVYLNQNQSQIFASITSANTSLHSVIQSPCCTNTSIGRINFSSLSSAVAADLSKKTGKTTTESIYGFASSLYTVEENASFSSLSRKLENISTQSVHNEQLQSLGSSTAQSFAAGTFHQVLHNVFGSNLSNPEWMQYQSLINNGNFPVNTNSQTLLQSLLQNAGSSNNTSLLNTLQNQSNLNLRVEANENISSANFLILANISIGNFPARINQVVDGMASLTPLDQSTSTFVFTGFPESLNISLSPFNPLKFATGTIQIFMKSKSRPADLAATVQATPFRIEVHQGQTTSSCLLSTPSPYYNVCTQIEDQAVINASYVLPNGTFATISNNLNSLDKLDTMLSSPDLIQIPILNYVQKSQSGVTTNFINEMLSLEFRFSQGIQFQMASDRTTTIQGFIVENLLVR